MTEHCQAPDCDRPQCGHGGLCAAHLKRKQRGKAIDTPIAEPSTPKQRALEASIALVECSGDDAEYNRLERAWQLAVRGYSGKARGELIAEALADAKRRGVRVGRPRALGPRDVARVFNVSSLSRHFGVARDTARKAWREWLESLHFKAGGEPVTDAELEALVANATPGPWTADADGEIRGPDGDRVMHLTSDARFDANARLMAAGPSLVAEVWRLRKLLDDVIARLPEGERP